MNQPDTTVNDHSQWPDREMTDAQRENRAGAQQMVVTRSGAMPTNFAEMVDYAKFMSTAKGAVGAHLQGNVGACLAIMEISKQFDMPAYAVARQSYLVNGRVAFMGQFFLAIINKYCPLKRKLQWRYEGDVADKTRRIIVFGTFTDEQEPREWTSPMLKDIAVQNSPLWKTNPDHQLIYFGVRGWQTVNWPEGMLSIQTDDEAAMIPMEVGADRARDVTQAADALRERLAASSAAHPAGEERAGFREGFAEGHFEDPKSDNAIDQTLAAATDAPPGDEAKPEAPKPEAKPATKPKAKDAAPKADKAAKKSALKTVGQTIDEGDAETARLEAIAAEAAKVKTPDEWAIYAKGWLEAETDPQEMRRRWAHEQKLRNSVGVTSEVRDSVFEILHNRLAELES